MPFDNFTRSASNNFIYRYDSFICDKVQVIIREDVSLYLIVENLNGRGKAATFPRAIAVTEVNEY